MAQAVKLTEATVGICATKTEQSPADMQAMLQDANSRGHDTYIVFDYYNPRGDYVEWSQMRELFFRNYFIFPWGEEANKFAPVVTVETIVED